MTANPATAASRPGEAPTSLPWKSGVELAPSETILAACRFDLDGRLRFTDGWIALTDRRVIADEPASADGEAGGGPRSWPLDADTHLDVRMRAAVGRIELARHGRVVARWLFTAARAKGAHALEDAFDAQSAALRARAASTGRGGRAGRKLPATEQPAEERRPAAASARGDDDFPEPAGAASWRALARVLSFARPHAGMAILGGVLSLASTSAALVPPYLTMPLVDQVLIPRQNGADIPFATVWWYLGGLTAAAVAAWLLSWAQTWTLAWVSERIAAGLRTRTYAHVQSLSLDFFQTKRTGDLISRVGSDTDKINVFLSVNLIEFASNVMLLALTAAVLVWLNPTLALLTLVPFPLVVWLVYAVRERLRQASRGPASPGAT